MYLHADDAVSLHKMSTSTVWIFLESITCSKLQNFPVTHSIIHGILYRAHKRTRCLVERSIGQWKRRFAVLQGIIRVKSPGYVCRIIELCAMLHNICKDRNLAILEAEQQLQGGPAEDEQEAVPQPQPGRRAEGLRYRDAYVDNLE